MKYVIYSPPYNESVGGVVALHLLSETLSSLGEEVYITGPIKRYSNKSKIISQNDRFDLNKTIVIYPEVVVGNPFNAKHVVRWLLNTPRLMGGDGIFKDTDLIYKYVDYFKADDESKVRGILNVFDFKLEKFYDYGKDRTNKQCFMVKKGVGKKMIHESNAIDFLPFLDDDNSRDIFNDCEMFISYDYASMHSIQAALCGCVSVVIPDENVDRDEFISKRPYFKYGIAYGMDDIERAKETMPMMRDYLKGFQEDSLQSVKDFVYQTKEHLSK